MNQFLFENLFSDDPMFNEISIVPDSDLAFTLRHIDHVVKEEPVSCRLPEKGRKRRERIEESKNVQTTPYRTYCKHNRHLPYYHPNCRI